MFVTHRQRPRGMGKESGEGGRGGLPHGAAPAIVGSRVVPPCAPPRPPASSGSPFPCHHVCAARSVARPALGAVAAARTRARRSLGPPQPRTPRSAQARTRLQQGRDKQQQQERQWQEGQRQEGQRRQHARPATARHAHGGGVGGGGSGGRLRQCHLCTSYRRSSQLQLVPCAPQLPRRIPRCLARRAGCLLLGPLPPLSCVCAARGGGDRGLGHALQPGSPGQCAHAVAGHQPPRAVLLCIPPPPTA